jgi:hypothetical protein
LRDTVLDYLKEKKPTDSEPQKRGEALRLPNPPDGGRKTLVFPQQSR